MFFSCSPKIHKYFHELLFFSSVFSMFVFTNHTIYWSNQPSQVATDVSRWRWLSVKARRSRVSWSILQTPFITELSASGWAANYSGLYLWCLDQVSLTGSSLASLPATQKGLLSEISDVVREKTPDTKIHASLLLIMTENKNVPIQAFQCGDRRLPVFQIINMHGLIRGRVSIFKKTYDALKRKSSQYRNAAFFTLVESTKNASLKCRQHKADIWVEV